MRLSNAEKSGIIEKFKREAQDTGSPEVQIALLTARVTSLTEHLKLHKKDFHSRRGLMGMVNRRRKLLRYLKRTNAGIYQKVIQELSLRG